MQNVESANPTRNPSASEPTIQELASWESWELERLDETLEAGPALVIAAGHRFEELESIGPVEALTFALSLAVIVARALDGENSEGVALATRALEDVPLALREGERWQETLDPIWGNCGERKGLITVLELLSGVYCERTGELTPYVRDAVRRLALLDEPARAAAAAEVEALIVDEPAPAIAAAAS